MDRRRTVSDSLYVTSDTARRSAGRGVFVVVLAFAAGAPLAARSEEPRANISGGVDADNRQLYEWTVTNLNTSPIVFIEFPQYHGDTFTAPSGWSQEWKNKASIGGGENAPGWVRTSVADPTRGIPPGGSAQFGLRVSRAGALTRTGKVTVRFADGSEVIVADVELPSAPTFFEQNAMLIGLAAIFVVALLVHLRRRRRQAAPEATQVPDSAEA
jgi:hypothetical protein